MQNPEAGNEEQKDTDGQVLKDGDPAQRETGIVFKQTAGGFRLRALFFNGRQNYSVPLSLSNI